MKTQVGVRCLSAADVWQLLSVHDCIEVMAATLAGFHRGELTQLDRVTVPPTSGGAGVMALLPAHRDAPTPVYAVKAVCVFPDNPARGLDAHQGVVVIFDGETGEPRCLADAAAVTALRTAAVSGLATRLLARHDSAVVAVIGAGAQALPHLQAMAAVRPIKLARLWSRSHDRAAALAARGGFPFPVEPTATVREAVSGADIVITVTPSEEPLLKRAWLREGAHINAIGAVTPNHREIDADTIAAASLFVDTREGVRANGGDVKAAIDEGVVGPQHMRAALGELLENRDLGRASEDELTMFKSVGLAVEDLAATVALNERATARDAGSVVVL